MSRISSVVCMAASMFAVGAFADDAVITELSLPTDTNAVIDVAEGSVTIIDKISGNRGTITKTGGGTLEVRLLRNNKVRFDVQGGRLYFARQEPSVCDGAFFHVDASKSDTLELEEENGTNFVVRWNDVRGNGRFATNTSYTATWRPNPEKRRAFISSVTQNGLPVVDFGPLLFNGLTNEVGEIVGYGASMEWNEACRNTREVYEVISETPDVATIAVDYPRFNDKARPSSFISSSTGGAGNNREYLKPNAYPNVFYDTSNNYGWMNGWVYKDGTRQDKNTALKSGKFSMGAGFHVMGFTTRDPADGYADYSVGVNAFARYANVSFGGQRIGEYLVFSNRLTSAERSVLQSYLVEKWRGKAPTYAIASLTVADGASVEFAPGVSIKVANMVDGADVAVGNGALEVNPLLNPDAFFHVDATCFTTLEHVNGTNFVMRWDDAMSNGVYATPYDGVFSPYRSDPENRRPFISSETLNSRPVVDFGSLLVRSHTNETGYGVGYGAAMQWSSRMTAGCMELLAVMRDTEDIKTLVGNSNVKDKAEYGPAYVCDPISTRGWRGLVTAGTYPPPSYDNSYNNPQRLGKNLFDGSAVNFKSGHPPEGFHVVNLQMAGGYTLFQPQYFAYMKSKDPKYSFGGTKIAEYIIFSNVLSNDVRTAMYKALRTKWFGEAQATSTLKNVTVAEGASLAFTWRDVSVTNRLTVGGALSADVVSAANLEITAAGATVSGAMTVADGAMVTVPSLADGSFGGLSAGTFTLGGGGTVVLSRGGSRRLRMGDYPLMTATGGFTGSIDGWSVDSSAFPSASARLYIGADGVYVHVEPPGSVILIF